MESFAGSEPAAVEPQDGVRDLAAGNFVVLESIAVVTPVDDHGPVVGAVHFVRVLGPGHGFARPVDSFARSVRLGPADL